MRVVRNLRLSLRAFSTHRVRTGLAVAGTAVGVAGVLVSTAIGEGARGAVVRRIESLGRNMLVVSAEKVDSRGGRKVQGEGWTRTLRTGDVSALLRGSPAIIRAAPAQDRGMTAKFGPIQAPATVVGTTPEWQLIRQFPLTQGRFFTADENDRRARVAVLGSAIRTSLFGDTSGAVGRTIRIGRVPFQVVGVLASKGLSVDGTATEDDKIFVPLETALRRLFNTEYLKFIYLEAVDPALMADAQSDAASILRVQHGLPDGGEDDFAIQNQRLLLAAELETKASFRRLIMGLGFLSLLVGGVGILSMMLLSVKERRSEIGLRVSVGARRQDIAVQFVAEALLLAVAGGLLGLWLGLGVAGIVSAVTTWESQISQRTLAVAIGSVLGIGLGFGAYPAWRAAALNPIEALQAE